MKKRILSMRRAIVIVAGLIPMSAITAFAATTTGTVTVNPTENGTVTADKSTAEAGETVTLTVTPDEGYVVNSVTVVDQNGDPVDMDENYSFTFRT